MIDLKQGLKLQGSEQNIFAGLEIRANSKQDLISLTQSSDFHLYFPTFATHLSFL
jgi:hypothetical protein